MELVCGYGKTEGIELGLVFAGDVEEDVVPAVVPVGGEAFADALDAFREEQEDDVAAFVL